ncbi:c-type cytochrome [Helicobacter pametensis]|uniref:c-type cytochrome n=1 Tax=Helicobacter pametensis TaxID=95149 RepID=UPI0004B825E5|nr:cytochrome c [Helicobacter pametensis]
MKHYKILLSLFLLSHLYSQEDFIDDLEYGKKLYENPRGISCKACHGDKGEGKLIATYKTRNKEKQLFAPSIRHLSYEDFAQNINSSKGVMPKYYLTEKEIEAIFKFLQSL